MIYVLLALFFLILFFALYKNQQEKFNDALKVGGLLAFVGLLLRLGPAAIGALVNLLLLILPFFKKTLPNSQQKSDNEMTKLQAAEILGVSPNATQQEIKSAFNKLIKSNHPDVGGSKYIAAQLVQAKEVLLGKRK